MIIVVLLRKVTNDNGWEWRGNYGGGLEGCVFYVCVLCCLVFLQVLEMKADGKFSQLVWCVGDYLQTRGMEH